MQTAIIIFTIAMVIVIVIILISFGVLYKEVKGNANIGGSYYNVYKGGQTGKLYAGAKYDTEEEAIKNAGSIKSQYIGTIKI